MRRTAEDGGDEYQSYYYYYYGGGMSSCCTRTNVKVGVAAREINGELFMLVLWRAL